MDWLDILAVQGTLKSLLQHHSSKALILCYSAFFMVQLSHTYMTTGKTIILTRRAFVSKVMSLLFNMLSRLVIAVLPRSKRLNFIAAVTISSDCGAQKNKVSHCFHCFPIYLPWSDGTRCYDLRFSECWVLSLLFHLQIVLLNTGVKFKSHIFKDTLSDVPKQLPHHSTFFFFIVLNIT